MLGPLLFLDYMSDLSYLAQTESTKLLLYADDILVYTNLDYKLLQQDLHLTIQWANKNLLQLNPSKC